jgi:hypothetical protein
MKDACEESPALRPSTPPLHVDAEGNQFWGIPNGQPIHIELDSIGFLECTGITLHRVHGPAFIRPVGGGEEWWLNGQRHREGCPAVTCPGDDGYEWWMQNGLLHREDGPALIDNGSGIQEWHLRGQLHRVDGPAHISRHGYSVWYQYGRRHREDGPAYISDILSIQIWYRHGVRIKIIEL